MKQVRVNIRTTVNASGIRRERRAGRDKIIVPSATLPDGIIMNDIKYPADEIAKSFASLEGKFAPLGHPTINGQFISASDPEGINIGWIGAHNENVRRENGRVYLDKVIDVARANESAGGKAVLAAIEKGEPIHTSTGLLCNLGDADGDDHKFIARNMIFDHDAILIGEDGAGTPEQGVGMLVNGAQIEVINSAIDDAERELDWAGVRLIEALERREKASVWDKLKAAILGAMPSEREPDDNRKDDPMTVTKEQFDDLSAKVNTLSETLGKLDISAAVANAIKPLTDNLAAMTANAAAAAEAEKAGLVAIVVKANILSEPAAKELTVNALKELAEKAKPGTAFGLNGAFVPNAGSSEFASYDPNVAITEAMKGVN